MPIKLPRKGDIKTITKSESYQVGQRYQAMAKCPKCGKKLENDDYVLEENVKIPAYLTMGNRAVPISCRHCETLLGFRSG